MHWDSSIHFFFTESFPVVLLLMFCLSHINIYMRLLWRYTHMHVLQIIRVPNCEHDVKQKKNFLGKEIQNLFFDLFLFFFHSHKSFTNVAKKQQQHRKFLWMNFSSLYYNSLMNSQGRERESEKNLIRLWKKMRKKVEGNWRGIDSRKSHCLGIRNERYRIDIWKGYSRPLLRHSDALAKGNVWEKYRKKWETIN
jgi:hypothetical protein